MVLLLRLAHIRLFFKWITNKRIWEKKNVKMSTVTSFEPRFLFSPVGNTKIGEREGNILEEYK